MVRQPSSGPAQALAQVDGYLRRMPHPEGVREAVSDTAGAAQMITDHGWRCGGGPEAGHKMQCTQIMFR